MASQSEPIAADDDPTGLIQDLQTKLASLSDFFKPTLDKPMDQVVANLTPLQKSQHALMQAYLIYDLIWMFLRVKGVDPVQHPVILELDRIKGYFAKVKEAETAKPTQRLDKDAASRFIKAAINSRPKTAPQAGPSQPSTSTPKTYAVDTSTRFSHIQEAIDSNNKAEHSGDSSDEAVFETLTRDTNSPAVITPASLEEGELQGTLNKKRSREDSSSSSRSPSMNLEPGQVTPPPSARKRKKKKTSQGQPSAVTQEILVLSD